MGKILALDFGLKHIGTAISDGSRTFAFAREKIFNDRNIFPSLAKLIADEKIVEIIISKSSSNEVREASEIFVKDLQEHIPIPVIFLDEMFTTKLALKIPLALGMSKKKREAFDDHSAAAAYLLETYLESQKS